MKSSVKEFFNYSWEVDFVMSDGSQAIHLACKSVFDSSYKHVMCSVHFWRNVEKKFSLLKAEDRACLKEDLKFLENLHSKDLFDYAILLFEQKWN